jgi:glutathione S-transferase
MAPTLKVLKFGPAFGLADASPFVMKVETYLRITGQKYEAVTGDVRKAPRQQLPVVEMDGKRVPDSAQIISLLEAKRPEKLDAHLTAAQHASAVALRSMLEEHLYFGVLYMRWVTDDGWSVFEPSLREMLGNYGVPSLVRGMVCKSARKQVTARTRSQGVGRQPRSELVARCVELIDAFDQHLIQGPYVCGEKPSTFDATAYAFAAGVLCPAFDNELLKHAKTKGPLVAYEARLKAQYWGPAAGA